MESILHQHGDRQWADPSRHRRHPRCLPGHGMEINVPGQDTAPFLKSPALLFRLSVELFEEYGIAEAMHPDIDNNGSLPNVLGSDQRQ